MEKILRSLKRDYRALICRGLVLSFFFIAIELAFKLMVGGEISLRFIWTILFSIAEGFLFSSFAALFPKVPNIIITGIIMGLADVWTCAQVCFYGRFQTYMKISDIALGGQAANEFADDFKSAIVEKIPFLIILVALWGIALFLMIILYSKRQRTPIGCVAGMVAGCLVAGIAIGSIAIISGGSHGVFADYKSGGVLDNNIDNFGLLTSFKIEARTMMFGSGSESGTNFESTDMSALLTPNGNTSQTNTSADGAEGSTQTTADIKPQTRVELPVIVDDEVAGGAETADESTGGANGTSDGVGSEGSNSESDSSDGQKVENAEDAQENANENQEAGGASDEQTIAETDADKDTQMGDGAQNAEGDIPTEDDKEPADIAEDDNDPAEDGAAEQTQTTATDNTNKNQKSSAEAIRAINEYVSSLSGSYTNEYTGMFEGKNVILICAESFSGRIINETLTPTLYKLKNEGFVFNNFYGTFRAVTTNGEYCFLTGLMPNTVGTNTELKTNTTFELAATKYMPYTLANVFLKEGAGTYAYHGNNGSVYNRDITHPSIGYTFMRFRDKSLINGKTNKNGYIPFSYTGRPTNDAEMVSLTMDDYLSQKDENGNVKRFNAYYMTYSGHHPYYDINDDTKIHNPRTYAHRDIVDGLNCSQTVKSYLAANLDVEDMLTIILEKLEEAGCLEDTVIVLSGDHYPYGLLTNEYESLAKVCGNPITGTTKIGGDKLDIYENTLIIYSASMKEPVTVDAPCCTADIVPTLLNLFGVAFDSRLLAGTDILDPQSFHIAMLYNKSFVTDKIVYDASKKKVTYLVDKKEVPQSYIDACISYVNNKFEMSLQIVQNDYYRLVVKD